MRNAVKRKSLTTVVMLTFTVFDKNLGLTTVIYVDKRSVTFIWQYGCMTIYHVFWQFTGFLLKFRQLWEI